MPQLWTATILSAFRDVGFVVDRGGQKTAWRDSHAMVQASTVGPRGCTGDTTPIPRAPRRLTRRIERVNLVTDRETGQSKGFALAPAADGCPAGVGPAGHESPGSRLRRVPTTPRSAASMARTRSR